MIKIDKKEAGIILLLCVFAAVVRIILFRYEPVITNDGVQYAIVGKNILAGKGFFLHSIFDVRDNPLYPVLIALSSLVFVNPLVSGVAVSIFFGSMLVWPVYLLARQLYSRKVALISSFIIIWYPYLSNNSAKVLACSTYVFFLVLAAYLAWLALREDKRYLYFLIGLSSGLAYLTRFEIVAYLAFFICTLIVLRKSKAIIPICLILCGFLLFSLPFWLYVKSVTGSFNLFTKLKIGLYHIPINASGTPLRSVPFEQITSFADYYLSDIAGLVKHFIKHLGLTYRRDLPNIFPPLLLMIMPLAFLRRGISKPDKKAALFLGVIIILTMLGYSFYRASARNLSYTLPFLIILLSKAIVELSSFAVNKSNRVIAVILCVIFISIIPQTFRPLIFGVDPNLPVETYEMAKWIKSNLPEGAKVISDSEHAEFMMLSFYAEKEFIPNPMNYDDIIKIARQENIDYIAFSEYGALDKNKTAATLKAIDAKGWPIVHSIKLKDGAWALLYKIRK